MVLQESRRLECIIERQKPKKQGSVQHLVFLRVHQRVPSPRVRHMEREHAFSSHCLLDSTFPMSWQPILVVFSIHQLFRFCLRDGDSKLGSLIQKEGVAWGNERKGGLFFFSKKAKNFFVIKVQRYKECSSCGLGNTVTPLVLKCRWRLLILPGRPDLK